MDTELFEQIVVMAYTDTRATYSTSIPSVKTILCSISNIMAMKCYDIVYNISISDFDEYEIHQYLLQNFYCHVYDGTIYCSQIMFKECSDERYYDYLDSMS